MKTYNKPEIKINSLLTNETISTLTDWLDSENYEYEANANITTYVMQSM